MNTLDQVREAISAAVGRAHPIEEARRSIELIAETSVRMVELNGGGEIRVVDDLGQPRTKGEGGDSAEFTIDDLIAEIRAKHPVLFKSEADIRAAQEAERLAAASSMAAPEPVAELVAAPQPAQRDWLVIDEAPAATASEGDLDPALPRAPRVESAAPQKAGGWFRLLNSAGPMIRIASNGMTSRLSGLSASMPTQSVGAGGLRRTGEHLRRFGGPVLRASAALVLLLIGGSLLYALATLTIWGDDATAPQQTAAVASAADPVTTGSVSSARPAARPTAPAAAPAETGPIKGVPEVLDTATLSIHGKVVRLFGIEWVRGAGEPADLAAYIRGREVSCEPAKSGSASYRCQVEGQDLSKVVLFNGGGRATTEATPDLQAAEAHAKSAKAGLWAKGA